MGKPIIRKNSSINNNVTLFELYKIQKKKSSLSNKLSIINSKCWITNSSLINNLSPTTLSFEDSSYIVDTDPSDDFFINELEQQNFDNIIKNNKSTYQKGLKDLNLAFKYDKEERYDEAYPIFKQHADVGNAEAQLKVGIYLRNRYVNSIDTLHSVKYLKKAALQNLPEAQYLYGTAIINRLAFGEKIEKGLNYLKMAALQNHILAMEDFGKYLKEGKIIKKDISQGEEFIKKASQLKKLKL
ncbi:unnamed protein product [Rhizophagus irregularis]|uniref:HCP-like protein n=1 Tax=Rhizophagus irregularis TaxID=588596 RepID=A0A2I1G821_9GLOM|nr:hypothetical protein RhiirC2_866808 [Rhizophagus irregularis]PKY42776.1 hypothetical protein RhiirA4_540645 [Rhizophagus irregularis]CAB4374624.1 unnamed protein product [Rhizophagus irregularis]CAB4425646.1 unnamed protein product [Rhizophagus irregularis]CAB5359011.1 unnamed protein product [Rhizophagus irregularis]